MTGTMCVDDFTKGLSDAIERFKRRRVRSFGCADRATALELAADAPMDAVILNCRRQTDNILVSGWQIVLE